MSCDIYFGDVVLLLHMEGVNGGIVFTDSSSYAHSVGPVFDLSTTSTTQFKYGTSSMFDNGGGLSTNVLPEFQVDAGQDYTLEAWIYPTAVTGFANPIFRIERALTPPVSLSLASGHLTAQCYDSTGTLYMNLVDPTIVPGANQWYAVALVRSGNSYTLYRDGVAVATGTSSATPATGNQRVLVGVIVGVDQFQGYIDELRFTNGTARYLGNYTPDGPFGGACTMIPDVVGELLADAETDITNAGFTVGTLGSMPSGLYPVGYVLTQSPVGGTPADLGTAVDLVTVSAGDFINIQAMFVGSKTFKAIEIGRVGEIKPRIWPARTNKTVYT